eukprot:CAMPEP_0171235768 /NCGR_PEP_ID=MMETSP0790-20130122/42110_1 /TAXON_ID=2925 /ORGANISM="Alexandrium catenella, Strain OF101" /LENGTH=57 /DNA_ID=CAMNT_0011702077 /DNA_START=65 /DNA_END=238 /DNA_ORIENTATION=-
MPQLVDPPSAAAELLGSLVSSAPAACVSSCADMSGVASAPAQTAVSFGASGKHKAPG